MRGAKRLRKQETGGKRAGALGLFCEGQKVAFVVKEYEGFTSVWCGAKYLQHDFLRSVAKFADCHLYNEQGEVLHVSANYISVHATSSGRKVLKFEKPCSLVELYEGKACSQNATEAVFAMLEGQTKTFEIV